MKVLILFLGLILYNSYFSICNSQDTSKVTDDFEFQLVIESGLHPMCWSNKATLTRFKNEIVLEFEGDYRDNFSSDTKLKHYKEKHLVDNIIAIDLINFLESSNFDKFDTNDKYIVIENGDTLYNLCYDCWTIKGYYLKNGAYKYFDEVMGEPHFRLVDLTLNLLNQTIQNYNLIEVFNCYAEALGMGFFRIKKIDSEPLTYKLKGKLLSEHYTELRNFLKSLPKEEDIVFDVKELNDIDPKLFSLFQNLIQNNKNITWYNPNLPIKKILMKDLKVDLHDIKTPEQ